MGYDDLHTWVTEQLLFEQDFVLWVYRGEQEYKCIHLTVLQDSEDLNRQIDRLQLAKGWTVAAATTKASMITLETYHMGYAQEHMYLLNDGDVETLAVFSDDW